MDFGSNFDQPVFYRGVFSIEAISEQSIIIGFSCARVGMLDIGRAAIGKGDRFRHNAFSDEIPTRGWQNATKDRMADFGGIDALGILLHHRWLGRRTHRSN
jgi:hypothetical protein